MNNKKTIQTFINETFNLGNTGVIDELVHQDYQYDSPSDSLTGPAELKAFIAAFRLAFPDLHVGVIDQVEDSDRVVTRLVVKGTHNGPFLDIPPTGNAIDIEGVVISRFEDGLIREEWELLDQHKFLSQLGAKLHFG